MVFSTKHYSHFLKHTRHGNYAQEKRASEHTRHGHWRILLVSICLDRGQTWIPYPPSPRWTGRLCAGVRPASSASSRAWVGAELSRVKEACPEKETQDLSTCWAFLDGYPKVSRPQGIWRRAVHWCHTVCLVQL